MIEIKELCASVTLFCYKKREHGILSGISKEFYCKGLSEVNINNKVLSGRPYGGIAILWKKNVGKCTIIIIIIISLLYGANTST